MDLSVFKVYLSQFITTLFAHNESLSFIRKHKLWEGLLKYGWLAKILLIAGILIGLQFISMFFDWINQFRNMNTSNAFVEMGNIMGSVALDSYNFMFTGGVKYLMLILLEVVIFHVCRRSIEILTGSSSDYGFNTFIKAQIRMIKVVIRTYVMEMIFTLAIKIFFGIFGTYDFLEPIAIFGLQCYFLGFLVMDNYLEHFNFTIKESLRYAKQYIGVSLAVGLVLNVLLLIPALGAIVAPIIAAVTVSLVMYSLSDLHLTGLKPSVAVELKEEVEIKKEKEDLE